MTNLDVVELLALFFEGGLALDAGSRLGTPIAQPAPHRHELQPHDPALELIELERCGGTLAALTLVLAQGTPARVSLEALEARFGRLAFMPRQGAPAPSLRFTTWETPATACALAVETVDGRVTTIRARRARRCHESFGTVEMNGAAEPSTVELASPVAEPALPFGRGPSTPPAPQHHAAHPDAGDTQAHEDAPLFPPVPFRALEPPREDATVERETLMPLERYAEVKVAVLNAQGPLGDVLEAHGLDEVRWRVEERRRAAMLARAAEHGDFAMMHALRRAMHAARRDR